MGLQFMTLAKQHAEFQAGRRVDIEAYQFFLPDAAGRYPWDEGCQARMRDMQPLLFLPLEDAGLARNLLAGSGRV